MTQAPDVLYVEDLAKAMGRTETAIRQAVNRGVAWLPPAFKLGRRLAWRRADVEAFLAKLAKEARASNG